MSKIEVNTIEPQCGTTLTVGAAGTNVTVPSNVVKSNALQASDAGNIIKQCGTTVTLGATGDTIALASGASQTGFGRTGTVDWITTPKVTGDSPITAVTGKGYFLNTTAGTITVNLPAGAAGSIVSLADYAGTWQTNNVTVNANGTEKIGGVGSVGATLNIEGQSVTFVYVDSTQGWLNTMDSTSNVRAVSFFAATVSGACNTLTTAPDCANVKIAKFISPGTFCVTCLATVTPQNTVGYMVVAGGAGGGSSQGSWGGGGGGAGGYREGRNVAVDNFTASPLIADSPVNAVTVGSTGPIAITVGGGGAGGPVCGSGSSGVGAQGNNSVFSSITGAGGGGGGPGHTPDNRPGCVAKGVPGGSGGGATGAYYAGACGPSSPGGTGNDPSTTPAQGTNGGLANAHVPSTGYARESGGGGGAGASGGNNNGGPGGNGVPTQITGSAVYYAGGAGGGGVPPGSAGNGSPAGGGGGNGATPSVSSTTGTINTGGGGGGGADAPHSGSAGGSGIVYIRYKFQ